MTEDEWVNCTDPHRMLTFSRSKVSKRKLRLFACACCRRVATPDLVPLIEVAERFADARADDRERSEAEAAADLERQRVPAWHPAQELGFRAAAVTTALRPDAVAASEGAASLAVLAVSAPLDDYYNPGPGETAAAAERRAQAVLLRCIVGNPFRRVVLVPSWRTPTTTDLAQAVNADGRFEAVPVLADALEDAGCTDRAILNHLRGPGPHVHGCWAVDLLTDRQ
jgi:hypothetical protein